MSIELSVSVIIPSFNEERYVSEAIDSILRQTYKQFEIVVVDDGSTDGTPAVAEAYGSAIRLDRQPHKGLSATLNRGIQLAQGDLIAFLDNDDVWVLDKLQKQIDVLLAQPKMDMVFGYSLYFASPDLDEAAARRLIIPDKPQAAYLKSAMLIRRQSLLSVGLFDTALRVGDFVDWYSRAMDAGLNSHLLPDVVFYRRVHGHNMTILDRASQGDYVRIAKAALDRRRAGARSHSIQDMNRESSR